MTSSNNNSNAGTSAHKAAKPMIWVRDESGDTFICPINAVRDPDSPTEAELSQCVNESYNPQNN